MVIRGDDDFDWGVLFMTYFINNYQVHPNTYNQYLIKELKRLQFNCNRIVFTPRDRIIINNIKFEVKSWIITGIGEIAMKRKMK